MILFSIIASLFYLSSCSSIKNHKANSGVYTVTDSNFNDFYQHSRENHGALVLYFGANPTPNNDKYFAEYKKAAYRLYRDGDNIFFGIVNVSSEYKLPIKYKVYEYPKVLVLCSNENMLHRVYEDEQSAEDIINHLRRIITPGPKQFSTLNEFYMLADHAHHLIAGFFEDESSLD